MITRPFIRPSHRLLSIIYSNASLGKLTEPAWSIKELLYGILKEHTARNLERILPAPVANHSAEFGSSCPLMRQVI